MNCRDEDTIVALATPPGPGAMAVIRISGGRALDIVGRIFRGRRSPAEVTDREVLFGEVTGTTGDPIDQVLILVMRGPRSMTGEDVVEIDTHGGLLVPRLVLRRAVEEGARPAEPGEFTKRAFLSGKMDLAQAEAVEAIVRASSEAAARAAVRQLKGGLSAEISNLEDTLAYRLAALEAHIDFDESDLEPLDLVGLGSDLERLEGVVGGLHDNYGAGKYLREGLDVVIVGKPNVGKSSLFNRLLGKDRAIVSEIAGTTRDVVDGLIGVDGHLVRIHDTAGLWDPSDGLEAEAVKRTGQAIAEADMALVVVDASSGLTDEDRLILEEVSSLPAIVVANKADLGACGECGCDDAPKPDSAGGAHPAVATSGNTPIGGAALAVSALKGWGVGQLTEMLRAAAQERVGNAGHAMIVNERQALSLREARLAIQRARQALEEDAPIVLIASDLTHCLGCLGEISGRNVAAGVLDQIFSRFCIGK
jgi:tRNA modification GTPase